jgi:hypothetical protein
MSCPSLPPCHPAEFLTMAFPVSASTTSSAKAKLLKELHSNLGLDDNTFIYVPATWIRKMNDVIEFSTASSGKITAEKKDEESFQARRTNLPRNIPQSNRRKRKASISSIINNSTTLAPAPATFSARAPFSRQLNHMNMMSHPRLTHKLPLKAEKRLPLTASYPYSHALSTSERRGRNIHSLTVNVSPATIRPTPSAGSSTRPWRGSYDYPLSPCSSADTSTTSASSVITTLATEVVPSSPVRDAVGSITQATRETRAAVSQQEYDALESLLSL